MKKFASLLLAMLMIMTMVACGDSGSKDTPAPATDTPAPAANSEAPEKDPAP